MKQCPVCDDPFGETVFNEDAGGFDNSPLYVRVQIVKCDRCGHLFNMLTDEEIENLDDYYNNEYSKINAVSINTEGDMPGSNNFHTLQRYVKLYDFIKPYFQPDQAILDVGCNTGGFLNYIDKHNNYILYGTDITVDYISKLNPNIIARPGRAEELPFDKRQFDMVVMDQVLEHVVDLETTMQEAKRVMKKNGYLCISLPDASRYAEHSFFPYYFFLMREHIHHFDLDHLQFLAEGNGFELVKYEQVDSPFMSDSTIIPTLTCLFKINDHMMMKVYDSDKLKEFKLKDYCSMDKYMSVRDSIKKTVDLGLGLDIYLYGMGREAYFLLENTEFKNHDRITLIDNNQYKINNLTINGKKIHSSDIIPMDDKNIMVFITAVAHQEAIGKGLLNKGFKGWIL